MAKRTTIALRPTLNRLFVIVTFVTFVNETNHILTSAMLRHKKWNVDGMNIRSGRTSVKIYMKFSLFKKRTLSKPFKTAEFENIECAPTIYATITICAIWTIGRYLSSHLCSITVPQNQWLNVETISLMYHIIYVGLFWFCKQIFCILYLNIIIVSV